MGHSIRRLGPVVRAGRTIIAGSITVGAGLLLSQWLLGLLSAVEVAERLPWYLSRAAGVTAYLLLTGTTVLGLAMSTRLAGRWLARPVMFGLHEQLAWLGLAATGLHLGALVADSYVPFGVTDLLIPFASPYRPGAVALGVLTLYLSAVITGSFYVRSRIGHRTWRAIHMASFVTYALATAHGIFAGSSTAQPWMQALYLGSGGAVIFLTNLRLLLAKPTPDRQTATRTAPRADGGALVR